MNPNWQKRLKDKKSFFAYARSKSRSKVKVGAIEDSQGELHSELKVKAEMLNDFFSTVFTKEDAKCAPVLKPLCDAKLVDISVDIIMKKLSSLKEDKAAGDDNLSPRLLKAIAIETAYPTSPRYL